MLTARVYTLRLIFFFYFYLSRSSIAFGVHWSDCGLDYERIKAADCITAMGMIPNDDVIYNADSPPSFNLPTSARQPKLRLPALFHAGTCMILVTPLKYDRPHPVRYPYYEGPTFLPVHGASAMFYKV